MYDYRSRWWLILPVLALAATGCTSGCATLASTTTKAVETIGAAEMAVAVAGVEAHKKELKTITDTANAKRTELGCIGAVGDAFPAGCDSAAWVTFRDESRVKLAAAEKRFDAFVLAMRTVNAALTEAAIATKLWVDTNGSFELAPVLAALIQSWSVVVAILKEWGITAPAIGVEGGK